MKITLYGGINEIGGNKILVESKDGTRIFLDFGRRLGFTSRFYQEYIQPRQKNILRDFLKLGLIPRLPNIYRNDLLKVDFDSLGDDAEKYKLPFKDAPDYCECPDLLNVPIDEFHVDGVFITHGHYDHFQDLSLLDPAIPIYCSKDTEILIKAIADLTQMKIENQFYYYYDYKLSKKAPHYKTAFPGSLEIKDEGRTGLDKYMLDIPGFSLELSMKKSPLERTYVNIDPKDGITLNSLHIDIIPVDHSVPGAVSFLVTDMVAQKTLLYSGDFRFEGIDTPDIEGFIQIIQSKTKKIDAFICEGTRIDSNELKTEKEIEKNITDKMKSVEGLILIDYNWKDLGRLQTILNCCKNAGRTLLIPPKIAYILFKFHQSDPETYLNPSEAEHLAVYLKRRGNLLYSPNDYNKHELGYFKQWGRNEAQKDKAIVRIRHLLDTLEAETDQSIEATVNLLFNTFKQYKKILETVKSEWFEDVSDDEIEDILTTIWDLATFHFQNGINAIQIRESPEKYVLTLSFWDVNELFDLSPITNDMSGSYFIRASTQPFNDEMVLDEQKMMTWMDHFNIKYEAVPLDATAVGGENQMMFSREHISGHATAPMIKKILTQLNPQLIIPVHTIHSAEFRKIGDALGLNVITPQYGKDIQI
ncbi:MAG: MBL fold metallo-hydrolase [Candidatus Helarchaeota archaeon]